MTLLRDRLDVRSRRADRTESVLEAKLSRLWRELGLPEPECQYEVRAGWTLQPNFQYIGHPGGGATNPLGTNPGKALKNAEVIGLRTVIKF